MRGSRALVLAAGIAILAAFVLRPVAHGVPWATVAIFWAIVLGQAVVPGVLLCRGARLCAPRDSWLVLGQGATIGLSIQGLALLAGRALGAHWLPTLAALGTAAAGLASSGGGQSPPTSARPSRPRPPSPSRSRSPPSWCSRSPRPSGWASRCPRYALPRRQRGRAAPSLARWRTRGPPGCPSTTTCSPTRCRSRRRNGPAAPVADPLLALAPLLWVAFWPSSSRTPVGCVPGRARGGAGGGAWLSSHTDPGQLLGLGPGRLQQPLRDGRLREPDDRVRPRAPGRPRPAPRPLGRGGRPTAPRRRGLPRGRGERGEGERAARRAGRPRPVGRRAWCSERRREASAAGPRPLPGGGGGRAHRSPVAGRRRAPATGRSCAGARGGSSQAGRLRRGRPAPASGARGASRGPWRRRVFALWLVGHLGLAGVAALRLARSAGRSTCSAGQAWALAVGAAGFGLALALDVPGTVAALPRSTTASSSSALFAGAGLARRALAPGSAPRPPSLALAVLPVFAHHGSASGGALPAAVRGRLGRRRRRATPRPWRGTTSRASRGSGNVPAGTRSCSRTTPPSSSRPSARCGSTTRPASTPPRAWERVGALAQPWPERAALQERLLSRPDAAALAEARRVVGSGPRLLVVADDVASRIESGFVSPLQGPCRLGASSPRPSSSGSSRTVRCRSTKHARRARSLPDAEPRQPLPQVGHGLEGGSAWQPGAERRAERRRRPLAARPEEHVGQQTLRAPANGSAPRAQRRAAGTASSAQRSASARGDGSNGEPRPASAAARSASPPLRAHSARAPPGSCGRRRTAARTGRSRPDGAAPPNRRASGLRLSACPPTSSARPGSRAMACATSARRHASARSAGSVWVSRASDPAAAARNAGSGPPRRSAQAASATEREVAGAPGSASPAVRYQGRRRGRREPGGERLHLQAPRLGGGREQGERGEPARSGLGPVQQAADERVQADPRRPGATARETVQLPGERVGRPVGVGDRSRRVHLEVREGPLLRERHLREDAGPRGPLVEAVARPQPLELLAGVAVHDHQPVEPEVRPRLDEEGGVGHEQRRSAARERRRPDGPPRRAPGGGRWR